MLTVFGSSSGVQIFFILLKGQSHLCLGWETESQLRKWVKKYCAAGELFIGAFDDPRKYCHQKEEFC